MELVPILCAESLIAVVDDMPEVDVVTDVERDGLNEVVAAGNDTHPFLPPQVDARSDRQQILGNFDLGNERNSAIHSIKTAELGGPLKSSVEGMSAALPCGSSEGSSSRPITILRLRITLSGRHKTTLLCQRHSVRAERATRRA